MLSTYIIHTRHHHPAATDRRDTGEWSREKEISPPPRNNLEISRYLDITALPITYCLFAPLRARNSTCLTCLASPTCPLYTFYISTPPPSTSALSSFLFHFSPPTRAGHGTILILQIRYPISSPLVSRFSPLPSSLIPPPHLLIAPSSASPHSFCRNGASRHRNRKRW